MRALVICAGGGAGDVLLATPVVRALRAKYASVVALTLPARADVLRDHPAIDDVWLDAGGSLRSLAARMRAARFDAALVTWSTARYAAAPFLARIPRRVGQARRLYSWMYTDRVTVRSERGDRSSHWTDILLDYVRALDCDTANHTPDFYVPDAARAAVRALLATRGVQPPYAVLHPARGLDLHGRSWPVATFARLAQALRTRFGMPVVITGTAADAPLARAVAGASGAVDLAGATTFGQLGALLAAARVCVAVDSGPMHLAAALGTPTVGIFALASDEPRRWAPLGPRTAVVTNTYPCPPAHRKETCPDFACVRDLDIEHVIAQAALCGRL